MLNSDSTATDSFVKFDLNSKINKVSFLIFGIGMLLPWNAMLAAMDFFTGEFPNYEPSFSLLVAVSAPMFIVQAIAFFFLQKFSNQTKVTLMFAISALITFGLVICPLLITNEAVAYWTVITLSVLFGSAYAIMQAALYGLAGPSMDLLNNLNLGIGISGLSVNILRILVLATVSSNQIGAQIFFYLSGAYMILCTIMAWRFVKEYELDQKSRVSLNYTSSEQYENTPQTDADLYPSKNQNDDNQQEPDGGPQLSRAAQAWVVYKRNWKAAVGVLISTAVQMAFFPGVMLEYKWGFIDDFSWFVITLVTYASLCDTLGRFLASVVTVTSKKHYLLTAIVRGAIFTTLYLFTFFDVYVFTTTWWIILSLFFLATSYGYWITLGFQYGADQSTGDQAIAGTIVGFHMTFGICLGSVLALTCLAPS